MSAGTATTLLKFLADNLDVWATARRGSVSIAQDPYHVLELLNQKPNGFRVIVHWKGDDAEAAPWSGITSNNIEIIVTYNRGLFIKPGGELITPRGGQPPLYEILGDLRAHVRNLQIPIAADMQNPWLQYRGTDVQNAPDGVPLDAYVTKWSIAARLESE